MASLDSIREIAEITKNYPRFSDGRIDYSTERICFVLNCVVVVGDEVLLTCRGEDVIAYPNTLNGISGFIDRTDITIEEQARTELTEELDAPVKDIQKLIISEPFLQIDEDINREWHVYAVLVEFTEKFEPTTNWENKTAEWFNISEAKKLELMPGFQETLNVALQIRDSR